MRPVSPAGGVLPSSQSGAAQKGPVTDPAPPETGAVTQRQVTRHLRRPPANRDLRPAEAESGPALDLPNEDDDIRETHVLIGPS